MSISPETYSKVFLVLPDEAPDSGRQSGSAIPRRRQCLICERVLSQSEAYEHSKTICYPPASNSN
jgi:hypothetical protein